MKKMNAQFLAGLVFGGAAVGALGGDITGKITLKGTPPKEVVLPLDPMCSQTRKAGETPPTTRFYVVDANGGLADVFVSLKSVTGTFALDKIAELFVFEPPETPVIIDQVGCEYVPYVLAVQAGQKIVVKNSDPVFHNVHPTPRVEGNPESNKAQLPNGKDLHFVFNQPEKFLRFKCDVHRWMFAYVNVVAHPFFAISGEDGSYTIKNVPPGDYEIEAIHRKAHGGSKYVGISKKITVDAEGATADFVVDITK